MFSRANEPKESLVEKFKLWRVGLTDKVLVVTKKSTIVKVDDR